MAELKGKNKKIILRQAVQKLQNVFELYMLYLLIHLVISKKERESQRGKNADRKRMDTYSRYRNTDRHTERWTDRQINRKAGK